MNKVYLSLGTNLGDRQSNLNKASSLLGIQAGKVISSSELYETQPWNMTGATDFLNQVILLETELNAADIMDLIVQIENAMGRVRTQAKYEPRVIDIDILFFNDEIILSGKLIVPHPLIHLRKFVLEPLSEIAPCYIHPVMRKNIVELLCECTDKYEVAKLVLK